MEHQSSSPLITDWTFCSSVTFFFSTAASFWTSFNWRAVDCAADSCCRSSLLLSNSFRCNDSKPLQTAVTVTKSGQDERLNCSQCIPRPQKLPISLGDPCSHPIHGSLGPLRVHSPNSILIGSAGLEELMVVSNRQTHTDTQIMKHQ